MVLVGGKTNLFKIRPWTLEGYTVKDLEYLARVNNYAVFPIHNVRYKRGLIDTLLLIRESGVNGNL
jgi:hypothetical protein